MITVMISISVKPDRLEEYIETAALLTKEFNSRPGCISYSFNQRRDKPTEFVLYEQWQDESDLDSHIKGLVALLGPPKEGDVFPEKLVALYENAVPVFYNTIT